ncbi:hypothetical protein MNBD_GAMMA11-500 [hydrothermal vent metagenome]|uniref:DUF6316 domain-containing protein n=1 Tax=hydrothermal vent metagenome TaxID=652676 RepID=A0A3B0WX00_9ZZZZ
MIKHRNDDTPAPSYDCTQRISRGYKINGQWYFELRGGGQKGPFDNEEAMLAELNSFIHFHELMNQQN